MFIDQGFSELNDYLYIICLCKLEYFPCWLLLRCLFNQVTVVNVFVEPGYCSPTVTHDTLLLLRCLLNQVIVAKVSIEPGYCC